MKKSGRYLRATKGDLASLSKGNRRGRSYGWSDAPRKIQASTM